MLPATGYGAGMPGARVSDHNDARRPADPGVDVEVPDVEAPKGADDAGADEPPVEQAPEEQEAG